jgi:hypothetical protein
MSPSKKTAWSVAFLAAVAMRALPAIGAPGSAGIRNGEVDIDATTSDVQLCSGDYAELSLPDRTTPAPYVLAGEMKGALGDSQVEVDLFTDQGALGTTTFGCQSAYSAICTQNDSLNRSIVANLTFCRQAHQKLVDIICFGNCPGIFGDIFGRSLMSSGDRKSQARLTHL